MQKTYHGTWDIKNVNMNNLVNLISIDIINEFEL
jgi:hypothetical protein